MKQPKYGGQQKLVMIQLMILLCLALPDFIHFVKHILSCSELILSCTM